MALLILWHSGCGQDGNGRRQDHWWVLRLVLADDAYFSAFWSVLSFRLHGAVLKRGLCSVPLPNIWKAPAITVKRFMKPVMSICNAAYACSMSVSRRFPKGCSTADIKCCTASFGGLSLPMIDCFDVNGNLIGKKVLNAGHRTGLAHFHRYFSRNNVGHARDCDHILFFISL